MNIALMVAIGVVAFAVGFAIKASASQRPANTPAANNHDFTFKGHFAVYKSKKTDKDPKKRPKHYIKVLYKKEEGEPQRGSVTFDNWTEEKIVIRFPIDSPFTASKAAKDFPLSPGASSGPQLLERDLVGSKVEDKYDFKVVLANGDTLDPGVKVRRA